MPTNPDHHTGIVIYAIHSHKQKCMLVARVDPDSGGYCEAGHVAVVNLWLVLNVPCK